jgi:hypothetical protein
LSFIVIAPRDTTEKHDCRVVDVVVMALQSILLLTPCTFVILDVVDPHQ